jgi:hypothetical protein
VSDKSNLVLLSPLGFQVSGGYPEKLSKKSEKTNFLPHKRENRKKAKKTPLLFGLEINYGPNRASKKTKNGPKTEPNSPAK